MRHYLFTIQHNMEKNAENRVAPRGFDSEEEAVAEFHVQMGKDMKNSTLDWALNMVINEVGGIVKNERWTRYVEPTVVADGSKVNPYQFEAGMTVEMGKWYLFEDAEHHIVQLCIKDGVATEFFTDEYFIVEPFYLENKELFY